MRTTTTRSAALLGAPLVLAGIAYFYLIPFKQQKPIEMEVRYPQIDWSRLAQAQRFEQLFALEEEIPLTGYSIGAIKKIVPVGFWKLIVVDASKVMIFNRHGDFENLVGSSGGGPGEYAKPDDVAIGENNDIFVLDARRSRVSVFDSSARYQYNLSLMKGSGDNLLVEGHRVFLYGGFNMYNEYMGTCYKAPDGSRIFAFARPTDYLFAFRANMPPAPVGFGDYLFSSKGQIYVSHPYQYMVREFSIDGEEIRQLQLESSTFEPPDPTRKYSASQPIETALPSFVRNILSYDGLLLVFFIKLGERTTFVDIFTNEGKRVISDAVPLPPQLRGRTGQVGSLWTLADDGYFYTWRYPDWDGKGVEPRPLVEKYRFLPRKHHPGV